MAETADSIGRVQNPDRSGDRRTNAIKDFMFMMQYRRDLKDAKDIITAVYPAQSAILDPDITQANAALRDAVIELAASRGG